MHMPLIGRHRDRPPAPPGPLAAASITDDDYAFIRDLVYQNSRINLGDHKKELVTARLGKRLRFTGLASIPAYIDYICTPAGAEERMHLIDAISTNHTFFMREMEHFTYLAKEILPQVLARKTGSEFRVWSAACSTGEEPYSAGLVIADALGEPARVPWTCDCSDISTRVLKAAMTATYDAARLRQVPPEWVRRFFQTSRTTPDEPYQVRPELRSHYRFHHLNLLGGPYPFSRPFHLIFCRNVMIYFDRATQQELVGRLSRSLAPGGFLFIGHAESFAGVKHDLRVIRPAIYRKPE